MKSDMTIPALVALCVTLVGTLTTIGPDWATIERALTFNLEPRAKNSLSIAGTNTATPSSPRIRARGLNQPASAQGVPSVTGAPARISLRQYVPRGMNPKLKARATASFAAPDTQTSVSLRQYMPRGTAVRVAHESATSFTTQID